MAFNVGDKVQLKSGGPEMTISKVIGTNTTRDENFIYQKQGYTDGDLVCQWFVVTKFESGLFKPETLKIIE